VSECGVLEQAAADAPASGVTMQVFSRMSDAYAWLARGEAVMVGVRQPIWSRHAARPNILCNGGHAAA